MVVDLYCGRGGWTRGFLERGFRVVGYDVVRHKGYPGELVIQDARTIDGRHMRGKVDFIVASPPCVEAARLDKPCWFPAPPWPDYALFDAARRIAWEARAPLLLENVRGAINLLGRDYWRVAQWYFWGWRPTFLPAQFLNPPFKNVNLIRDPARRAEVPLSIASWVAERVRVEIINRGGAHDDG